MITATSRVKYNLLDLEFIFSGLPPFPASSCCTCPMHTFLLMVTDYSQTFHVPLCLWDQQNHIVKHPTPFCHLAGSHSSLMTPLWASFPNTHFCSPMHLLHTFNLGLSLAVTSLRAATLSVILVFSPIDMFQKEAKEQMYKWY